MTHLVRLLIRLHPRAFRDRFGEGMCEAWRDGVRAAGGRGAQWHFHLVTLFGLLRSAVLERLNPTIRDSKRGEGRMMGLWTDIRLSARALVRRPGYTAIAVLTIALGIGANTAIFSLIHGVLLTPLEYRDPESLHIVGATSEERPDGLFNVSMPEIERVREVEGLSGGAGTRSSSLVLTGWGPAERIRGASVTHPLMELFGVRPHLGRDLTDAEAGSVQNQQIVLAWDFWRGRLGGDPGVLGTHLTLDGGQYEVVGVAPDGWSYPEGAQFWVPGGRGPGDGCWWGCHNFSAIVRLAPESNPTVVEAGLISLARSMEAENPDSQTGRGLRMESLLETQVGQVSQGLWILMATVGVVLLIACANVANLMLVRGQGRRGEIAVRAALGAGRGRLIRSVLAEGLVLAGGGAVLGVALAAGVLEVIPRLAAGSIPRLDAVRLSPEVLGFTLAATLAATLAFALLPSFQIASAGISGTLRPAGRGAGTSASARMRKTLLAAEVALSLVLLVGAGLLLRTFGALASVDPGYATENIVRFNISLPDYVYDEAEEVVAYVDALDQRLEAIVGVRGATTGMGTPLSSMAVGTSARLLDRPDPEPGQGISTAMRAVSPGYFALQQIELLRGRDFDGTERAGEPSRFLVNQTFVDRYLTDRADPLGTPVRLGVNFGFGNEPGEIIGVVEDVRTTGIAAEPTPEVYVAQSQYTPTFFTVNVLTEPGVDVREAIQLAVAEVDPDVPVTNLDTIEEAVRAERAEARFYLALLAAFAGLAVILAAVGLYGVVSYLVAGRTREFGIRVALGADRPGIMRMVLQDGLKPALAGLAVGTVVALGAARVLQSLLYGVEPLDPVTFATVPVLLLAVSILALVAPARRATRVDPVHALRSE